MKDIDNLEDTLLWLLQHKSINPEGANYKKLTKILVTVQRNVFIGPKTLRYVSECVAKLDNIECTGLSSDGTCTRIVGMGKCKHTGQYSACSAYDKVSPDYRGGTIRLGGQDG